MQDGPHFPTNNTCETHKKGEELCDEATFATSSGHVEQYGRNYEIRSN